MILNYLQRLRSMGPNALPRVRRCCDTNVQ